jgi:hypothetical protein
MAELTDVTPVGLAVGTAADAEAARAAMNIDGQVIGTADALPNESGFWWTSEPVAVDGKVFMGTVAADQGSWVQEWTQTDSDGPFYLHRYFMGFAQTTATGPSQLGRDDLRDDHNPAQVAVKAGKPLVVFWSGHGTENLMYYRVSDQAVDAVRPGELTFGPIKTFAVPADQRTSYTEVMVNGDDIWVAHRTGYNVNQWTLTKFPAWATGTPVSHNLVVTPIVGGVANQLYMKARMVDGVIRCLVSTHPTNSVAAYNKIWYVEVNAATGAVTKSDGTVLGNLDGTNLPLDVNASLEVVFTAAGTSRPWGFDVGYGPVRELAFTDAVPSNFAATAKYRVARNTGSGWTTGEVTSVGNYLSATTGNYFPSINFVPGSPDQVLLARATGVATGVNYVEKWATTNGSTWAVSEVVDEVPINFTAGPLRALTRTYPVRVESGVAPFDVIGTEILEYPGYDYGWEMRVRPLPLSHTIKRVPADDPIVRGLGTEKKSPQAGLYVPALTGNYIEGPSSEATVPTEGIRLEVDVALPNWVPGVDKTLLGKESTASLRGPRLVLNAVGRIGMYWSEDGSTFQSLIPNEVPLPPFQPWQRVQIAVDFIPKHAHPSTVGGFQRTLRSFYRFSDDEPWTGLSVAQTSPGTTMHKGGTSPWEVGARRLGTTDQTEGVFYRASVMKIGGEVLAEWRAGQMSYRGTCADVKGNTWTVRSPNMEFRSPVLVNPKISTVVDPDNNILIAQFDAKGTSATPNSVSIFSGDVTPGFEASGGTNVGIQAITRGTGAFRVYSPVASTPTLEGFGISGNADFRIVTQSVGRVLINGVQAETKGHTHVAADVVGAPAWVAIPANASSPGTMGQMAHDGIGGWLYVCVANNQWRRTALTTWV